LSGGRAAFEPLDGELRDLVGSLIERLRVPGAAIAIVRGESEQVGCFGVTNIEHPAPIAPDTLFQVGSITRTVTATAAMRLMDAGRLDIDAPIRTYLPDFRLADEDVARRVTLRHIFTHRAGWSSDHLPSFGEGDDALARCVAGLADMPQLSALGEIFNYLPSAASVAGRVIEVVTGEPYEVATRRLVLEPLGMRDSCFTATEAITHSVAVGHHIHDERPVVARPWGTPRSGRPGAGLITSLVDMLGYLRFQLGDGRFGDRRVLSERSFRLMHAPLARAALGEYVGLAWFVRDTPSGPLLRHAGGSDGHYCWIQFAPLRGYGVVMLSNASNNPFVYELTRWLLARYLGIEQPRADRWLAQAKSPDERILPFVGHYDMPRAHVELVRRDQGLVAQVTLKPFTGGSPPPALPPMRLVFTGVDRVVVIDPPWHDMAGEFIRDPGGRLTWLQLGDKTYAYRGRAAQVTAPATIG